MKVELDFDFERPLNVKSMVFNFVKIMEGTRTSPIQVERACSLPKGMHFSFSWAPGTSVISTRIAMVLDRFLLSYLLCPRKDVELGIMLL